jgi:hypothetical protein
MRTVVLTVPEVAFIAGTRGALGLGAGLLLSRMVAGPRQRALGWTLLAVGLVTTIPAARKLFGRRRGEAPSTAAAGAVRAPAM